MILAFIFLITAIQILLYWNADRLKLGAFDILIPLSLLGLYFFVIPQFFYPEPKPESFYCGMPLLAINLAFWFLGGGLTISTHLIYSWMRRIKNKNTE